MKKLLLLLFLPLLMIGQTVPSDATSLENIQITNNITDDAALWVSVQDANGVLNKVLKSSIKDVLEYNSAINLPVTGTTGKVYVTKDNNKLYRWNGTFYQELAGSDITYQSIIDALTFTPENVANKQNSLVVDGSGAKYATVDAVNIGLSLKANSTIKNKKWVTFGDSFSDSLGTDGYQYYVAEKTGMTGIVTHAVSGAFIGSQISVLESLISANPNYFQDFEICSILLGVNDCAGGAPLGHRNSLNTETNYAGYLKKFIETILTSNKKIKLYVLTPPEANGRGMLYKASPYGWSLRDLSVLIGQICADYAVQVVDLNAVSGFNLQTIPTLTNDLLHPNIDGNNIIADILVSAFQNGNNKGKDIDFSVFGNTSTYPALRYGSLVNSMMHTDFLNDVFISSDYPSFSIIPSASGSRTGRLNFSTGGIDAYIESRITSGELIIASGRSVGWGGSIKFFTDTTEKGSISSNGVLKINNLSGSGSRIVTADASGNLSAPDIPTAPTAPAGTNTTQIATTAFVKNAVDNRWTITGGLDIYATDSNSENLYTERVFIGTSTPLISNAKFQVNGNIYCNAYVYGSSFNSSLFQDVTAGTKLQVISGSWVANKQILAPTLNTTGYTVATLPTGVTGATAYVTDALTPAYLNPVVGGGTVVTPVFYNGTTWVCH